MRPWTFMTQTQNDRKQIVIAEDAGALSIPSANKFFTILNAKFHGTGKIRKNDKNLRGVYWCSWNVIRLTVSKKFAA